MRLPKSLLLVVILLPIYGACSMTYLGYSGEVADRSPSVTSVAPVSLAPNPQLTPEAVVQIYGARVATWHGYFGVHTWIATKRTGEDHFTVHEVTQSSLLKTGSCVLTHVRIPDEPWYGNRPELLQDLRGANVDALITKIEAAVQHYPFAHAYRIWPGPNSNTFVAHVAREVPELRLDLPATAVGKDYLGALPFARTPSGTGAQLSLFGLAGVAAGWEEGLEINLFGITFGIDPNDASLKLPLLGRVGPKPTVAPPLPPDAKLGLAF